MIGINNNYQNKLRFGEAQQPEQNSFDAIANQPQKFADKAATPAAATPLENQPKKDEIVKQNAAPKKKGHFVRNALVALGLLGVGVGLVRGKQIPSTKEGFLKRTLSGATSFGDDMAQKAKKLVPETNDEGKVTGFIHHSFTKDASKIPVESFDNAQAVLPTETTEKNLFTVIKNAVKPGSDIESVTLKGADNAKLPHVANLGEFKDNNFIVSKDKMVELREKEDIASTLADIKSKIVPPKVEEAAEKVAE